jgi:hypothetical protein
MGVDGVVSWAEQYNQRKTFAEPEKTFADMF